VSSLVWSWRENDPLSFTLASTRPQVILAFELNNTRVGSILYPDRRRRRHLASELAPDNNF